MVCAAGVGSVGGCVGSVVQVWAGVGAAAATWIAAHQTRCSLAVCLPFSPPLQVKALLAGAMAAAVCVISANKGIHEGLSALLTKQERVEGEALERWLQHVVVSCGRGPFCTCCCLFVWAAEPGRDFAAFAPRELPASFTGLSSKYIRVCDGLGCCSSGWVLHDWGSCHTVPCMLLGFFGGGVRFSKPWPPVTAPPTAASWSVCVFLAAGA